MTPERWQQIQRILDLAYEAPEEQRRAVVRGACAGNREVQCEVEALLSLDADAEDFIEDPLWNLQGPHGNDTSVSTSTFFNQGTVPQRIGNYRLERLLGKGGMGEVFLAVRENDYQQRVALKLVSKEISRAEVLSRFLTERQILARLEHPDIARLLDGGALDDQRPYFVMEYVEGEPIDRYCSRHSLSLRERLKLFRRVCAAVHYAHQNLVVHRDLKASNILVTEEGAPRLLDFGIAKLLQGGTAQGSSATMPGLAPMTPASASPEQVLGIPITTACDIYALGVLLYRVLVSRPPYRIEGQGFAELVRVICEEEPPRPSMAALEQALEEDPDHTAPEGEEEEDRPLEPSPFEKRRLHRRLQGDLDAIVMKALRKEPEERYGSAAELAEDIRRHLVGLPVEAQRGNWFYYTSKFVRRNKLAIATLILLIGFAITATVQWRKAADERTQAELERSRAERNQAKAEKVTNFLTELFESATPDATRGAEVPILEVLDRGKERIEEELIDEPDIRAEIWGTLGTVYQSLGLYTEALELKQKALDSWRAFNSEDDPELADHLNNLANIQLDMGLRTEAEDNFRQTLEMRRRLGQEPRLIALAMKNLGVALMRQGKDDEAEPFLREALAIYQGLGEDGNDLEAVHSLHSLGILYRNRGEYQRAEPLLREVLKRWNASGSSQPTQVAQALASLGQVLYAQGKLQEAREVYERGLALRRRLLPEGHPKVANNEKHLAEVLADLGEITRAQELIEHALESLRASKPEGDWLIADAESVLGYCLLVQGRHQEAEAYLLTSYRTIRDARGEEDPVTRKARERILHFYSSLGMDEN